MTEFLSLTDIETRLYPSNVRIKGSESPKTYSQKIGRLTHHLDEIDTVIAEMRNDILETFEDAIQQRQLRNFYNNLLTLAENFLDEKYPLMSHVSMHIASIVLSSDSKPHTKRIYDIMERYQSQFTATRKELKKNINQWEAQLQREDSEENKREHEHACDDYHGVLILSFECFFAAASRLPLEKCVGNVCAQSVVDYAVNIMIDAAKEDAEFFHGIMLNCHKYFLNDSLFPNAVSLAAEIYIGVCQNMESAYSTEKFDEDPDQTKMAYECIILAGNLLADFHTITDFSDLLEKKLRFYINELAAWNEVFTVECCEKLGESLSERADAAHNPGIDYAITAINEACGKVSASEPINATDFAKQMSLDLERKYGHMGRYSPPVIGYKAMNTSPTFIPVDKAVRQRLIHRMRSDLLTAEIPEGCRLH